MYLRKLMPSLAVVASGVIITGTVAAAPATASGAKPSAVHATRAAAAPTTDAKVPSKTQLAEIRNRQAKLAVRYGASLTFAKATAKTFTVNTTTDTSLNNPASTHCIDTAGKCSLRAAVEAANNLTVPVRIVLGK